MKRLPLFLLPCLMTFSSLASDRPGPETMERLVGGEILLLDTRSDHSGGSASVRLFSHSPARAFWDVIISCELAFAFVAGIETCEVLEEDDDRALVHQVVKKGWPIPTQDFTFESLREPYRAIRFRLVEGNLKEMEGDWRFTEVAGGVLVDYQVRVVPGVPAPRFIVRRNIRKGMPDLVACVRGLAGGSASETDRAEDLERCPGDPAVGTPR